MASTFSQTLRLELIGDGEQSGTWGQTTNTNLGTLLEQAITGVVNITMVDANYTLTNFNGVSDEARNAVLVVGGTNSQVRDIVAPLVEKLYVVKNSTSGGFGINIRGTTGSAVLIPNGATVWVYCDGTNFNAVGTESVGNFEVNGNLTVTGNTNAANATYTGNVAALNFSGGGLTLTSINASNISAGTIANARTTANSANGASTIVLRDADGSFAANVVSATNVASSQLATNFNFIGQSNVAAATLGGTDVGIGFTGIKVAYKDATDLTNATSFPLQVFTNNAAQLTVTGAGNVGIGTTSPLANIEIKKPSTTELRLENTASGTGTDSRVQLISNTGVGSNYYNYINSIDQTGRTINWAIGYGVPANTLNFCTGNSNTEHMRIDSSGNVGIGTSSPTTKLNVAGLIRSTVSANSVDIGHDGTNGSITSTNSLLQYATGSNPIILHTNGTERMRIASDGDVNIGATSSTAKLTISGKTTSDFVADVNIFRTGATTYDVGRAPCIQFSNEDSVGSDYGLLQYNEGRFQLFSYDNANASWFNGANLGIGLTSSVPATTNNKNGLFYQTDGNIILSHENSITTGFYVTFMYGGVVRGAIQGASGGAAIAYNSFSDYRLKENVAPMTGALDKVARLKPVTYTWKSNGLDADGFIAHELQEVCPNAVSGEKDAVDEDGNPIYQGVDTSFLVATLTAAIQEQQAIINDLKARIETLENKK